MTVRVDSSVHLRWLSLVGSLWICTACGLTYVFSIFSTALKASLQYSQQEIDLIGAASDMGGNVGLICGALSAHLPDSVMLGIGAAMNFVGYGMVWLAASGKISGMPLWQVAFFMWLGVNGSTFFNTVALLTSVRNFPHSRGVIVGLLGGLVGLSGAIYTQVYSSVFAPDQLTFLLLLAVGPALTALLVAFFSTTAAPKAVELKRESEYMNVFFITELLLVAFIALNLLLSSLPSLPPTANRASFWGIVGLLLVPLLVPLHSLATAFQDSRRDPQSAGLLERGEAEGAPLLPEQPSPPCILLPKAPEAMVVTAVIPWEEKGGAQDEGGVPGASSAFLVSLPDFSVWECLQQLNFWLLLLSLTCGAGSALTALNNLAQIGAAQGYADVATPVALVSVWNCVGRVVAGVASEKLLRRFGLPRPVVLGSIQALMAVGHLLFAFAVPGSLYIGSLVVGVGLGVSYAMVTAIASEIFGLTSFGMVYNIITTSVPFGSYLFSVVLAGYVYDRESERESGQPLSLAGTYLTKSSVGSHGSLGPLLQLNAQKYGNKMNFSQSLVLENPTCTGAHCFQVTFLVMAFVCLVGTAANAILTFRTRELYKRLQLQCSSG